MEPIEFKRFTDAHVLNAIPPKHLAAFFDRFTDEIEPKYLPPAHYLPGTGAYYDTWVATLKLPHVLPRALIEAILAIEELASDENRALLDARVTQARVENPHLDPSDTPECLALRLWLLSPYKRAEDEAAARAENATLSPFSTDQPSSNEQSANQPSTISNQPASAAILPSVKIDSESKLAKYFMPHQIAWIFGEEELHAQDRPVFALAEKSVRIGWTYADAFKNVRKRLHFPNRDYLFATKDYQSALEYMLLVYDFARLLNFTRAIVAHGEDYINIPRLDPEGRATPFTEEIKVSYVKFDNKSRILAFSAHPQAMSVYGGDVGLDEFAKHPNAQLLWQTAQGRVSWGHDMAVWSSHQGEDTLFNQFAQQARAGKPPWNLYYRVTMTNAIDLGLIDVINRTRGTQLNPAQFVADCQARSGTEEIFQQTYMCNPVPGGAGIVDWSAIERCRSDYAIERVHLEAAQVLQQFGETSPSQEAAREHLIEQFLRKNFSKILAARSQYRLGFDVAASGKGNLSSFYIDEVKGAQLWLQALLTFHTEDWHFLSTVLHFFLKNLRNVQGAGDASGLGQQICWEAARQYSGRFFSVNFTSKKQDLGFALMNQLSAGEKCFPRGEPDIAADYLALRKTFVGSKWVFSEGRNSHNPASHCDIAWAGAPRLTPIRSAGARSGQRFFWRTGLFIMETVRRSSPTPPE